MEGHAIPGGSAAGLERDPLLDKWSLLQSVTQMETGLADLAGDGAARVADCPSDAVAARPDKPPGPAAGGLAFFLHNLVEKQSAAGVHAAASSIAHCVTAGYDHVHGSRSLRGADEEALERRAGAGRREQQKGKDG
jgi:hypothetical protein